NCSSAESVRELVYQNAVQQSKPLARHTGIWPYHSLELCNCSSAESVRELVYQNAVQQSKPLARHTGIWPY
ncbi:hypothetical protein QBJ84_18795, partial [Vibrio sp. NO3-D2]|nr:hypothetical protein [Vibrio sp. NO3-D2]